MIRQAFKDKHVALFNFLQLRLVAQGLVPCRHTGTTQNQWERKCSAQDRTTRNGKVLWAPPASPIHHAHHYTESSTLRRFLNSLSSSDHEALLSGSFILINSFFMQISLTSLVGPWLGCYFFLSPKQCAQHPARNWLIVQASQQRQISEPAWAEWRPLRFVPS